jgi:hypothetical protein
MNEFDQLDGKSKTIPEKQTQTMKLLIAKLECALFVDFEWSNVHFDLKKRW